jgi:hypothetical protein
MGCVGSVPDFLAQPVHFVLEHLDAALQASNLF